MTPCCISSGSSRRFSGEAEKRRSSSSSSRCFCTHSLAPCTHEIDGVPAVDVLLAGLFGYGAANTAFAGLGSSSSAGARRACSRLRATPLTPAVYLTAVHALNPRDVRAAVREPALARRPGFRREHAGERFRFRRGDRARRRLLCGAGTCGCIADPLGGGGVGRRERGRVADGVPLGALDRRRTSRPSCRRSPTCCRSRTSSTSSTGSTSTAIRSSPIRKP